MKRLIYLAVIATIPLGGYAQDQSDALRYSQLTFGGTARFMAMGGAFCAVGGDMSTLTFNPAGVAVFTKSQLTFSPGFAFRNTTSDYNGSQMLETQPVMTMQNAGMVAAWKNTRDDAMWKGISFGIVYNRTNNFNSFINIQGNNYNSTLLDVYTAQANGTAYTNLDNFYTGPAFNAGLLDTSHGNNYFNIIHPMLNGSNYITQQLNKQTSGSMGETDISFGGNYENKLYIGASMGIANINYNENTTYSETPSYNDTTFGLRTYSLNSTVFTSGAGVNFKFGLIYRINDWARIGAAIHTPTVFSLHDDYSTTWSATYGPSPYSGAGGPPYSPGTSSGSYDYTLVTPMRAMAGLAFILHHQGILSLDYEYVNYPGASFRSSGYSYSAVNSAISQQYMNASNLRAGFEWVLYPFSLRAGYAMYGDPYSSLAGNSTVKSSYCAGVGVRIRRSFIDVAYVLTNYTENYYLYGASYGGTASHNTVNESNVAFTFGVNF